MMKTIQLRDVTVDDFPIFYDHQLDPDATRMAAFRPRDENAFMAHWAKILGNETGIKKTILFDGQVAGNIVSFQQAGEREIGYWIGKRFWGQGVASKALSEFLGCETTRPLYAHVAKHNKGSLRVLEKCGFTIVGEDKEFFEADGEMIEGFVLRLG